MKTVRSDPERGSGTMLATMLISGLFAAGLLLISLAVAHQARWQAQLAADLGALAAASAWRTGFDPCEIAMRTVELNRAVIPEKACVPQAYGQVRVSVVYRFEFLGPRQAKAYSVAGPRPGA